MNDLFVTFEHLHSAPSFSCKPGLCMRSARELCRRYGLDWQQMLSDGGIAASQLIATGDALALHLVEHAKKCEADNG